VERENSGSGGAGKTAEQLSREIDLAQHGNFAADARENAAAVRTIFAEVPGP